MDMWNVWAKKKKGFKYWDCGCTNFFNDNEIADKSKMIFFQFNTNMLAAGAL